MGKRPRSRPPQHAPTADEHGLVDHAGAERIIPYSAETLKTARARRQLGIPFYRLSRNKIRYSPAELRQWLKTRHVAPAQQEPGALP